VSDAAACGRRIVVMSGKESGVSPAVVEAVSVIDPERRASCTPELRRHAAMAAKQA
jgi:hypothetical protein